MGNETIEKAPYRKGIILQSGGTGAPVIRTVNQHCWRVFYTKPRAEQACELRLDNLGVDVFLPKRTMIRTWSDRKKKVVEPLFRSYIFANVNELGRLQVLQDSGIVTTIRDANGFAALTDSEIEALKMTQRDPEKLGTIDFPLPPVGLDIEVTYGVFAGLKGEVIMHRNKEYIIVRIASIGQAIKVNIAADWVRKLVV